jgi:hypothetical protein
VVMAHGSPTDSGEAAVPGRIQVAGGTGARARSHTPRSGLGPRRPAPARRTWRRDAVRLGRARAREPRGGRAIP